MSTEDAVRVDRAPSISEVRFRLVPQGRDGLLAYASCRLGDHILNDIAVRRAKDGNIILTYPRRLSSSGTPHYIHRPVNRHMAEILERAILGEVRSLLRDGEGPARP
jgi:DNA-binding cell septation regulator SpoVG